MSGLGLVMDVAKEHSLYVIGFTEFAKAILPVDKCLIPEECPARIHIWVMHERDLTNARVRALDSSQILRKLV